MAEDMGERTEQPTGRRRAEARDQGNIPKSPDLTAAIDMSGSLILLASMGGAGVAVLHSMMRRVLSGQVPGDPLDPSSLFEAGAYVGVEALKVLVPALLAAFLVAAASQYVQVGWLWTLKPLQPKWSRLNVFAGFGRLFAKRNVVKTAVNVVKLAVIMSVAATVIDSNLTRTASLPRLELLAGLSEVLRLALELAAWLLALLLVIGIVDWSYQKWQNTKDLKMTKQEVEDERRSMEGDPEIKGRRLRMARDIAFQRIGVEVPRADVVVANPTHFSVALRYDSDEMRAPRVTAKGADLLAWRIKQVAAAHGVPVVERPPLARGLYFGVEVGREVPAEYYEAVAEVLAYVYRIEGRAAPVPA